MSRTRIVRPGLVTLSGRAWCGKAPIASVEVSTDGGATWSRAELEPSHHRWAWRRWQLDWVASDGSHEIVARATAEDGTTQPVEQPWNRGGFANNAVHRVPVECIPDAG